MFCRRLNLLNKCASMKLDKMTVGQISLNLLLLKSVIENFCFLISTETIAKLHIVNFVYKKII